MTTTSKPLKLVPPVFIFGNNYADDQKCLLRVVNDSDKVVAYRLRAARPAFYRMANAEGVLEPAQTKDLEMVLKKGFPFEKAEVDRHKMICLTLNPFEEDVRNKTAVNEIFSQGQEPGKQEVPLTLHPPPDKA